MSNLYLKITTILLFCLICLMAKSMPCDTTNPVQVDSTYFSHQDTIFITLGDNLEKFVQHEMQAKQTVYSIARFFGLRPNDLYAYNIDAGEAIAKIGAKINIPIANRAIIRFKGPDFQEHQYIPIVYRVKKGETLYRIARKYFRMPVETLQLRNNLYTYALKEGQALHIGWMHVAGIEKSPYRQKKRIDYVLEKYLKDYAYKKIILETGVGFWQKNTDLASGLYGLHNTAPINSKVAVTNPMNNRTVIVKIIGRIPKRAYKRDEKIILSAQAAKQIKVKDARFLANVRFYK